MKIFNKNILLFLFCLFSNVNGFSSIVSVVPHEEQITTYQNRENKLITWNAVVGQSYWVEVSTTGQENTFSRISDTWGWPGNNNKVDDPTWIDRNYNEFFFGTVASSQIITAREVPYWRNNVWNQPAYYRVVTLLPDSDGDGVADSNDDFPYNPSEWSDSDDDGVGDNADAFANDPAETTDTDGDGVGDNADAFANDPTETTDTDGDGVGDNADAFANDPAETTDTDGDGVGDNADAFANDPTETTDTDGDGVGDNADYDNQDPLVQYEPITINDGAEPFISEYGEWDGGDKYFEIYNPSDTPINLNNYFFAEAFNGSSDFDRINNFSENAVIPPKSAYLVAHPYARQELTNFSNENVWLHFDWKVGLFLLKGRPENYVVLDSIGKFNNLDWSVAGYEDAFLDHTLMRKPSVVSGNLGSWESSAGNDENDSEWIVLDQYVYLYLGIHSSGEITSQPEYFIDQEPFFSEVGSRNNEYIEIFNPSDSIINLDFYALAFVHNGGENLEKWINFNANAKILPNQTYVIARSGVTDLITADQYIEELEIDGNDAYFLVKGDPFNHGVIDAIGTFSTNDSQNLDSSIWAVAGSNYNTPDRTLERKSTIQHGNQGDWISSAGTNFQDSEWVVYYSNYISTGSHTLENNISDSIIIADEPFISEFAEGSSSNQYFEIYNPTDSDIDLNEYFFAESLNGNTNFDYVYDFKDGAIIPPGGVYMVSHDYANDALRAKADETKWLYFDRRISLFLLKGSLTNGAIIDSVGKLGNYDWDISGFENAFTDKTLIRKPEIKFGNRGNWSPSQEQNVTTSEWVVLDTDFIYSAGNHSIREVLDTEIIYENEPFFSKYSNSVNGNNFLQIYNPSSSVKDLSEYMFCTVFDGGLNFENWLSFPDNHIIAPFSTYLISGSNANAYVHSLSDWNLSNILIDGSNSYFIVKGSFINYVITDSIGTFSSQPVSGWDVTGLSNASSGHTFVRKSTVSSGNVGQWEISAGTNIQDSEWMVFEEDAFDKDLIGSTLSVYPIDSEIEQQVTRIVNPVLTISTDQINNSVDIKWSRNSPYVLSKADSSKSLGRGFFVTVDPSQVDTDVHEHNFSESIGRESFYQLHEIDEIRRPINILSLHGSGTNGDWMRGSSDIPGVNVVCTEELRELSTGSFKWYYPSGTHQIPPSEVLEGFSSINPFAPIWNIVRLLIPLPIQIGFAFQERALVNWAMDAFEIQTWYAYDLEDGDQVNVIRRIIEYSNNSIEGDVDVIVAWSEGGSVAMNLLSRIDEYLTLESGHPDYLGNLKNIKGVILINAATAEAMHRGISNPALIPEMNNFSESEILNATLRGEGSYGQLITDYPDQFTTENVAILSIIANQDGVVLNPALRHITELFDDNTILSYDGDHFEFNNNGLSSDMNDKVIDWIYDKALAD